MEEPMSYYLNYFMTSMIFAYVNRRKSESAVATRLVVMWLRVATRMGEKSRDSKKNN